MECYKREEGALRYIADLAYNYDGNETIKELKRLIDEIRHEALKALEFKEDYRPYSSKEI